MFKKISTYFILLLVAIGVAACGKKAQPVTPESYLEPQLKLVHIFYGFGQG